MAELLARDTELARLDAYLRKALDGHGQVCFVSGEAGAGKTSLIEEFTSRAIEAQESLIAVAGTCDAHTGAGDPFLPFREIMEQLTGGIEERNEQAPAKKENARRLRHVVVVAGETLVDMAPDLIGVVIPGASLLAKAGKYMAGKSKWADKLHKQIDGQYGQGGATTGIEKAQVYEQYINVLQRLSQEAPLLLIVDDLQWADTASLGLLFRLARRLAGLPIMLVGTYRPNDIAVGRGGERHPLEAMLGEVKRYLGDVIIDLDEARKEGGRAFVDAYLDQEPNRLDDGFREALVAHTGGHPLFTIELLRDLQERGDIVRGDTGAWSAREHLEWDDLPTRVEGVIEERIARLDHDTVHSLRVASVEGPQFTAEIVAKVQPTDLRELIRLLSESLQRQHRLVIADGLKRIAGQRVSNYRFAHQLMQSYLYRQLDEAEASYLHEDVGLALETLYGAETEQIAVHLARHFDLAGLPDKAVPYMRQAGRQAAAKYANVEALDHYRRALELLPETAVEDRYEVLLAVAELHDRRSDRESHSDDVIALTEVAEKLGDPLKLAVAHYHRAQHETNMTNADAAIDFARRAAEIAAPLDDDGGVEGRARIVLGRALMIKTDYEAAKVELQRGLVLSRLAGNKSGEGLALSNLGIMSDITGQAAAARSYFEQALEVHEAAGNRHATVRASMNLAVCYWRAGELDDARRLLEEAVSRSRELGALSTEGTATSNLAMVMKDQGDLDLAREYTEQAIEINREHNGPYAVARTLGILASIHMMRFDYTAARAAQQEARELDESVNDSQDLVFRLSGLGQIAYVFGQYEKAEGLLQQALDLSREIHERYAEAYVHMELSALRLAQGDAQRALESAQEALKAAIDVESPLNVDIARILVGNAHLALGDLDAAAAAYQEVAGGQNHRFAVAMGLADVALARGDKGTALDLVAPHLDAAIDGSLTDDADPVRSYLTMYSVLRSVQDARAHGVLSAGRALVTRIADKIDDPEARTSFDARADVRRLMGGGG